MSVADKGRKVLDDYRNAVRPFLEQSQVAGLDALDRAAEVLAAALAQKPRLSVGFAGESQVGKSSLINALLERATLPAGGVGPLTASATNVRFAADPTIEVTYHGKKQIQQLAFVLETHLLRQGQAFATRDRTTLPEGVDATEIPPDPKSIEGEDASASEAREQATKKVEYLIAQSKTLLAGNDKGTSDPPAIPERLALEGLRALIGLKLRCDSSELAPFEKRIAELKQKLGTSETIRQSALGSSKAFNAELRLRAAGWLSPMIAKLDVALDSPLVQALDITDLPGIGVVGDPAAMEAQRFVTNGGGALVLVMRNNGMTEELARLLEKAGVIRRLLFGGRDGRPPIRVLVAVTHLDDVARERHARAAEEAGESETVPPSTDQVYRSLAEPMVRTIRNQLAVALRGSRAFEDLPPEYRDRRERVVANLIDAMHIECVAAPDYAALTYRKGITTPTLLQNPEATGVPELRRQIVALAKEMDGLREETILSAQRSLQQLAADYLTALEQLYSEGGGQAQSAWDTFREELQAFAKDLKPELAAHQGEALAVLRSEVPKRIENLCLKAEKIATTRLTRLRSHGETLHYQSLNAALLRNGIWERRGLDYPDSITSALVDAIATAWEPEVIDAIRDTLRAWAERSVTVVEKLVAEARRRDQRIVTEAQIETQQKILVQQSRTAVAWTKERLEELRENVQRELYEAVLKPIEKACAAAVKANSNKGAGAKHRILDAFHEGGMASITKGSERAEEILTENYRGLLAELNRGFLKENHDPVQAAFDALTNEQLLRARRSDAQKRRRILDGIADARLALEPAPKAGEAA